MTKLEYEQLLKPLVDVISNIELDLLKDIIERIDNYDGVKGSLEWYFDKLNETNIIDKDSLKLFEDNKEQLKAIIENIVETCGNKIDNFEKLEEYYNKGLLNINPNILYDSLSIDSMINEAIKDTNNIMNLIQTKAIEGAKKAYKDVINKAYIETASGIYSYTESIRRALNNYTKSGISTVNYESGRTLSIEAVVRRDVITRMNKLVGDTEIQHAKELDTNLVYVDQHLGARVRTKYTMHDYEAHAEWQGKKYMIEGSSKKYPNLYETTGYGEMLGLKGINCYHNMRPTWEWEEIEDVIDEEENKKKYEQLEQMRSYERNLRELKRRKLIAKETNDIDTLRKINKKYTVLNSKYDNFLEENNLTRDYSREYVSNRK